MEKKAEAGDREAEVGEARKELAAIVKGINNIVKATTAITAQLQVPAPLSHQSRDSQIHPQYQSHR